METNKLRFHDAKKLHETGKEQERQPIPFFRPNRATYFVSNNNNE